MLFILYTYYYIYYIVIVIFILFYGVAINIFTNVIRCISALYL